MNPEQYIQTTCHVKNIRYRHHDRLSNWYFVQSFLGCGYTWMSKLAVL